jgi:hypothetical protein
MTTVKLKKNLLFVEKNIINLSNFKSIKVLSNYAGFSYSKPYNCVLCVEFFDGKKCEVVFDDFYKDSVTANLEAEKIIEQIFNLLINFNSKKTIKDNIII